MIAQQLFHHFRRDAAGPDDDIGLCVFAINRQVGNLGCFIKKQTGQIRQHAGFVFRNLNHIPTAFLIIAQQIDKRLENIILRDDADNLAAFGHNQAADIMLTH